MAWCLVFGNYNISSFTCRNTANVERGTSGKGINFGPGVCINDIDKCITSSWELLWSIVRHIVWLIYAHISCSFYTLVDIHQVILVKMGLTGNGVDLRFSFNGQARASFPCSPRSFRTFYPTSTPRTRMKLHDQTTKSSRCILSSPYTDSTPQLKVLTRTKPQTPAFSSC